MKKAMTREKLNTVITALSSMLAIDERVIESALVDLNNDFLFNREDQMRQAICNLEAGAKEALNDVEAKP